MRAKGEGSIVKYYRKVVGSELRNPSIEPFF